MRILRHWLVTMFDAEKRKERFFQIGENAQEALLRSAQTLQLSVRKYEPVEIHVQLLTVEEARAMGLEAITDSRPLPRSSKP